MDTRVPFDPDIVVTDPDSSHVLLIVEAKVRESMSESEPRLQHYMWEMSCPVGLLASPQTIVLYRNLFTGYSNDSIEKIGTFQSPSSWSFYEGPNAGVEFERRVQSWLEGLKNERTSELSSEAAEAFAEFVIPYLLQGEVRAAGPRMSRGSGVTFSAPC
jgi:hypothetical protein